MASTFNYYAGEPDCWSDNNGNFNEFGTALWIAGTTSTDDREVYTYMPFTVANIPQGTKIAVATLKLTATRNDSTTCPVIMACNDADTSTPPTTRGEMLSMVLTTAQHSFSLASYTTGNVYEYDITAAVQEVFDRAGWAAGNVLGVMIKDNSGGNTRREVASYENTSYTQAVLEIITGFIPMVMGEI
jgi:hypothetical protein